MRRKQRNNRCQYMAPRNTRLEECSKEEIGPWQRWRPKRVSRLNMNDTDAADGTRVATSPVKRTSWGALFFFTFKTLYISAPAYFRRVLYTIFWKAPGFRCFVRETRSFVRSEDYYSIADIQISTIHTNISMYYEGINTYIYTYVHTSCLIIYLRFGTK